jgi:hypothetical protein
MEVIQGWDDSGKKATVIRVSNNVANYWSAWDSSMANPTTQHEAQQAFGSMLTCARKVVRGFGTGTPLEAGCVTAPIRNLYAWHSTCKRFVESKRVVLRTARSKIPSPADYQGTLTTSFCEQAVSAVDQLIRQLWHFVESRTEPPDDQIQAASTRGDKINLKPIHADDLLTLVSSELALLQWTAKRWTMKALAERIGMSDDTLRGFAPGEKGKGKRSNLTDDIVIQICQRVIEKSPTESHRQGAESLLSELKSQ